MTLTNPLFAGNERIRRAARNAPPMARGEPDQDAVRILQQALIGVGAATMRRSIVNGVLDGQFGGETHEGVKRFQVMRGLTDQNANADGTAGRQTWQELDRQAPHHPVSVNLSPGAAQGTPPAETPTTTRRSSGPPRLPNPTDLYAEYQLFRDLDRPGKPCDRDITHQCAIRMSVALMRCDIGFHFTNPALRFTHRGGGTCGVDVPHNAGAQRLFDHLTTFWQFVRYRKSGRGAPTWRQIAERCASRQGIVFFKDLASRRNGGRGDHIDYWDGQATMNDLLAYNAPDERSHQEIGDRLHFFRKATEVHFLALSGA